MQNTDFGQYLYALTETQAAQYVACVFCFEVKRMEKRVCDQNRVPIYEALQTFRQRRMVPYPGHRSGGHRGL